MSSTKGWTKRSSDKSPNPEEVTTNSKTKFTLSLDPNFKF